MNTSEEKSAITRAGDDHSERTCAPNLCTNLRKCSCTDVPSYGGPGVFQKGTQTIGLVYLHREEEEVGGEEEGRGGG